MNDINTSNQEMSRLHHMTIFICFLMNILDGMDVLVISYCAPAIAQSWTVGPEALGIVFSSGLAGMTIGALFLASLADKYGRKKTIIISAIVMGSGIFLTSYCQNIFQMGWMRFISGIGIGSMLASTAVLTAEFTPHKTRDFWVSLVISGYPVGAVLAGLVAAKIVPAYGWETMFRIAGITSLVFVPAVIIWLSESLEFYLKKQPKNALQKANAILTKMQKPTLSALPEIKSINAVIPFNKILGGEYKRPTLQLWLALFLAFCSLYFLTSWIPKLAVSAGLSLSLAIYAGTVFNVGAFFGVTLQGYFSSKYGLKRTIGIFLICTAILMAIFKVFLGSDLLLLIFGLLGFGIQGGFVGLYAVAARLYPTEFRSTGVGWTIGIGRLGGIVGPALGGILVGLGLSMSTNFLIFSVPTLLAGLVTLVLSSKYIS